MVDIAISKARTVWKNTLVIFATTIFGNSFAGTAAIANPLTTVRFSIPDKSIDCVYQEDERDVPSLRCQTKFVLRPLPPKPADCDLDWGGGLRLENNGQVSVVCAGDTVAGNYTTLAYGRVWEKSGLRCIVRRPGLTCTSSNGKGFFLSRASWRRI